MLPIGSVVYSSRASIGKIGIATKPLATNQGFTNFICKEGLSNLYLTFALKHFTDDIASLSNSTTLQRLVKQVLNLLKFLSHHLENRKKLLQIFMLFSPVLIKPFN
ncbi:MAG: restriction endonuclease subunit S [Segetibacter sp.]